MTHLQHPLAAQYTAWWDQAWPQVRQGQITCDPHLPHKTHDQRRGLTVIARLAPAVTERMAALLEVCTALEPQQYSYPEQDIHLTVLSLFTTTEHYQPYLARLEEYRDAVAEALAAMPSFELESRGMTLSVGAVLAQGFPRGEPLAGIRERLRTTLRQRGLGATLDQRYHLVTAHSTLLRFAAPLQHPVRFTDTLAAYRDTVFGTSTITSLDLVVNDWYMSFEKLTPVACYPLSKP